MSNLTEFLKKFKPLSEYETYYLAELDAVFVEKDNESKELSKEETDTLFSLENEVMDLFNFATNSWNYKLLKELQEASKEAEVNFKHGISEKDSFGVVAYRAKFGNFVFLV